MTSDDLLALFREEMNDEADPSLWSDSFIYNAIDDAQKMFCRNTDGIGDATTPEVVNLNVLVDPGPDPDDPDSYVPIETEWYATHPSIKKFRTAKRADTGRDVLVINEEQMTALDMFFDGRQGPLKAIVIGMEENKVRVWPVPSEAVTVKLMVFRLPLVAITDDGDQQLEIAEQHHRHLLLWAKHLAYSVQDAEAYDKTKAAEFEAKFNAYCAKVQEEQRRARHKTRVVQYGGL